MSIKILSLNVNGLRDKIKRRAIFNYCRDRADIICLQETHTDDAMERTISLEWRYQTFFSHGDTNARGVCTLINGNQISATKHQSDKEG